MSLNKNAINILQNNLDKINWPNLSINENAIGILRDNLDNVNWDMVSQNKNISSFLLDYNLMKTNMHSFLKELVAYVFNPTRLLKLCELYNIEFEILVDLY